MKPFYITTAIDYVNSLPHIGTAYEKIAADCIARSKRLLGYDVRFCMGTDEHSVNVKKKALESGLDPKAYCDRMAPGFTAIWKKLSISYDDFIRTTESRHVLGVTALFEKIRDAGDIYSDVYKGWYCEGCEAFIQEKDLVDGSCPNHRTKPAWIEERNYFFRLSSYGGRLLDHIGANPDFIRPESRKNEIVSLIKGGLDDISVSRSGFDWGIPLPGDPGHVVYVWFDALINYISALGYGSEDTSLVGRYWPADLHIIGKDITRFHCVIWPAMLMSAGEPLPKSVFGHGFIYHRGEKMSKSLGNVVSPLDVADRFGADPLRYFLLREVVFGNDGDFTFERFVERYNSDLANDLGNLYSRVVSMIGRYFDGIIPDDAALPADGLAAAWPGTVRTWRDAVERYDLSAAMDTLWAYVRAANRRVEESAPWAIAKDTNRRGELAGVLYDLATACAGIAVLAAPAMPATAESMWAGLSLPGSVCSSRIGDDGSIPAVPKGMKIEKGKALFPRIEAEPDGAVPDAVSAAMPSTSKERVMTEGNKKEDPAGQPAAGAIPSPAQVAGADEYVIDIEDFRKVDIRIGTVRSAEPVAGSAKLMRLDIDDGMSGRTILAGIAKHVSPDDLVGKQVVFVANLKPRKMMGEMSQGMVLAASEGDSLFVLRPTGAVSPGTRVS